VIKWDSTYSVGEKKMDKQHKQLFGLIEALKKYRHISDRRFLKKIIRTLNDYISEHFSDEEKLMAKVKYPFLTEHRKQHQIFIQKVSEFENEFDRGEDVTDKMMEFLNLWLANHILIQDKAYETHILNLEKKDLKTV
jgi:hemerythrin